MKIPGNRWVILGILLYAACLAVLSRNPVFGVGEALFVFVLFVVVFPLLSWVSTLRAKPLSTDHQPGANEMILLVVYFVALSLYLIGGPQFIDGLLPRPWIDDERIKFFVNLGRKMIVFVLIPLALFRFAFGAPLKSFGISREGLTQLRKSHLMVVLILSAAILVFQYFMGGAAAPIRQGEFSAHQLLVGLPLCFAWLALEAGLVEEFCFRGLLQSRLAAWFRSEVSGVALMTIIFGLAHAPGFIFRKAGLVESLGPNPSTLDSIAYAIAIVSVGGVVFGLVWARTRNLFALILIHAAFDLLPNFAGFAKTWRL